MSQQKFVAGATRVVVTLFLLLAVSHSTATHAQTDDIAELKRQAIALMQQTKSTEALPLLEKIVAAEPDNARMQYLLASALLSQTAITKDEATRKALSVRARKAFIKSKELGIDEPNVDAMIQGIPVDGADSLAFSSNSEANDLMRQAEGFFAQGKLDEALKAYQKALVLDPHLYHAALFCGDVFKEKGDFAQAEIWYQKAIAIDPTQETAYRYSATPLMIQKRFSEARDRYIEAFITEPYSRFTAAGLTQWAQATNTPIGHPRIDIPTSVTFDEKGDAKINLDMSALMGKDDGSFAWISYGATRTTWHKETFAKTFPNERTYRHSLAEEADALRSVITIATSDKKTKQLSAALSKLKKLNDEGLLEAYILMARPDAGIAQDHPAYLKQSRDKLRQYVVQYVITAGGN